MGIGRSRGTQDRPARPGSGLIPWGYLFFTVGAALLAAWLTGWRLAFLVLAELLFGLACSRAGLRFLGRPRFWLFLLLAVALGPFLLGEADAKIGPFRLSEAGFLLGVAMAGRVLALSLAFSIGLSGLSFSDFVAIFDRFRLRGLGFALALAMNLVGPLQEMALVALQTLRLRGGARRPWLALRLFLVTVVANTLHYRDDLVSAATMRAFDPNGVRGGRRRRLDNV